MQPKSIKKKRQAKRRSTSLRSQTGTQRRSTKIHKPSLEQLVERLIQERTAELTRTIVALRESEERAIARTGELEALLNTSPIPIWIARTADCRVINGNEAAAELIGAPLETNVSQSPGEHPIDVPLVVLRDGHELAPHEMPMQRAAASGQPVSEEFHMILPDGKVKCLDGRAVPLKDASGKVTGVIASFADITKRKQAEEALRRAHDELEQRVCERTAELAQSNVALHQQLAERRRAEEALRDSEQRFRAFLDHAPNLAFVKGTDGRYLYVNRRFEEVFRFQSGTALGKTDVEIFPRDEADHFQDHDRQVLESGEATEFEEVARHADGLHTSIVVKFPLRNASGKIYAIGGMATDITDRKRAEEALRGSEARTRAFLENSATIAWIKDAAGRHVYLSPNYERRFGVRLEDWLGKTDFELWPPEIAEKFRENDLIVLRENHRIEVIEEVQDADGSLSWWLNCKFPYEDVSGKRYVGGLGVDVTERKRAEEALRHNEQVLRKSREELSELAGHLLSAQDDEWRRLARELHDDLNQRLAALALDLQVLGRSLPASLTEAQSQLASVQQQVVTLSDDVHDLAYQLHPSLLDDVGLEVALQDLVTSFGQREKLSVLFHPQNLPPLIPKPIAGCLYRVAQESLRNVAKHGKASQVVVSLSMSSEGLNLSVKDNGKGFAAEQGKLPPHRGLGLISMQERLRLVNGAFTVQSRPGHGTKVCAWVPFWEE